MALPSGTRFGPYEILAPLGAGGMGEVYRAKDSRLGREVAIKVLPEAFAKDPEIMARFEREARVLASLSHPHIASVHGLEEDRGQRALVMELVDGLTLAERIEQGGALPLDEALPIAKQIAEALESAHERGIVHRDLKPSNVKVTASGSVKVLDFGLAKALDSVDGDGTPTDLASSPTFAASMTRVGIILGTAAYMSPEQARGKFVDRRTDIWAFGVVLFEMLIGRQIFQGETVSDTIAAVIKDEIPWNKLPATTPPSIRHLLQRCLDRNPHTRLQSIGEARIAIERGDTAPVDAPPPVAKRGRDLLWIGWSIAGLLLGALAILAPRLLNPSRSASPETRKYSLRLLPDSHEATTDATISPDGKNVAFYSGGKLYVRNLVTLGTHELTAASVSAMRPFWSPDGKEIGFSDGTRLNRISVNGGSTVPICTPFTAPLGGSGGSWCPDGRIVFALGAKGLFEAKAVGGDAHEILPVDSTSSDYHDPLALPGTEAVAFIRHRISGGPDRIALFDGKDSRDLFEAKESALWRLSWSPSGHILFYRVGTGEGMWALPFSLKSLQTTGDPFLVAGDGKDPSMTTNGTLVYSNGLSARDVRAVWLDRNGAVTDTLSEAMTDAGNITISPDGSRAALTISEKGNTDIYVLDLARRTKLRLTFDAGLETSPFWSPDGRKVFYIDRTTAQHELCSISSQGGESPEHLIPAFSGAVSPDGLTLAITEKSTETGEDIFVLQLGDENSRVRVTQVPGDESWPDFAPNGKYLAYDADEGHRREVFICALPPASGRWQVSNQGGRRARWSPDGKRLYYQSIEMNAVYEVEVEWSETPTMGLPRRVFEFTTANVKPWGGRNFDRDLRGERFLALAFPKPVSNEVILVENWFQEFRKSKGGS